MVVLGDGLVERRRCTLPTTFCAVDGEHGSYAWLLWRLYIVSCKCEEIDSVFSLHLANSSCLKQIWLIPSATAPNFATLIVTRFFGGGASSVSINIVGGTITGMCPCKREEAE